jgi:hypothetical protein
MPEKMFIKLTDEDWGYTCHDKREHGALASLVPYVRDRVLHVLIEMVARGHDPYCLWGRRTLVQQLKMVAKKVSSLKQSRHLVGKAADIVDHGDLLTGGSGWNTSERFWANLIAVGTAHRLYSGFGWSKYGRFGDSCHLEWRGGAILKLPVWLLRLASRQ